MTNDGWFTEAPCGFIFVCPPLPQCGRGLDASQAARQPAQRALAANAATPAQNEMNELLDRQRPPRHGQPAPSSAALPHPSVSFFAAAGNACIPLCLPFSTPPLFPWSPTLLFQYARLRCCVKLAASLARAWTWQCKKGSRCPCGMDSSGGWGGLQQVGLHQGLMSRWQGYCDECIGNETRKAWFCT